MEVNGQIFWRICLTVTFLGLFPSQGFGQTIQPIVPSTQSVTNGQRVVLDCAVTASSATESVAWYHDNNIISYGATFLNNRDSAYSLAVQVDASTATTYHWIITISSLLASRDTGMWSCRLEVTPTNQQEQDTQLFVRAPPILTFMTGDLVPNVGTDVTLQCNATGSPEPTVTWSRSYPEPYILMGDGSKKGFTRRSLSNTVTLTGVNGNHRGRYVCAVSNGLSDPLILTSYVQLPYVPEVRASLERVRVVMGSEARLACVSQAFPPTSLSGEVTWTKDGQDLGNVAGYSVDIQRHPQDFYGERHFSRLTISNVDSSHAGSYDCSFTNSQGTGSASVMLGLEPLIDPSFGGKQ